MSHVRQQPSRTSAAPLLSGAYVPHARPLFGVPKAAAYRCIYLTTILFISKFSLWQPKDNSLPVRLHQAGKSMWHSTLWFIVRLGASSVRQPGWPEARHTRASHRCVRASSPRFLWPTLARVVDSRSRSCVGVGVVGVSFLGPARSKGWGRCFASPPDVVFGRMNTTIYISTGPLAPTPCDTSPHLNIA